MVADCVPRQARRTALNSGSRFPIRNSLRCLHDGLETGLLLLLAYALAVGTIYRSARQKVRCSVQSCSTVFAPEACRMKDDNSGKSIVFVVDDDPLVRDSVSSLLRSVGLQTRVFASTSEFLQEKRPPLPSCLVLDVRLPGVSGLDFQAELSSRNIHIPIIFMTGHGDIPMTVRAMKAGAVEFLTKPFREQDMLDAVKLALERDQGRLESEKASSGLKSSFEALTPREREIMAMVASGLMNKQVAGKIGLSEITVKVHRGRIMQKMGAKTLADLVRMAETLGIRPSAS
jgi:FixJ family two-component response regulator